MSFRRGISFAKILACCITFCVTFVIRQQGRLGKGNKMNKTIDTKDVEPIYFKFRTENEANDFAVFCGNRDGWDANEIWVVEVPGKGWAVRTLGDSKFYFMGVKKKGK